MVHVYNVQSGSRIWLPIYIFNSKLIIFDNPYIWILKFILYNAFTIYENWILHSSTSILYEQTLHKYIKNLVSSKRIIGVLTKILWLFTGNIKAAVTYTTTNSTIMRCANRAKMLALWLNIMNYLRSFIKLIKAHSRTVI